MNTHQKCWLCHCGLILKNIICNFSNNWRRRTDGRFYCQVSYRKSAHKLAQWVQLKMNHTTHSMRVTFMSTSISLSRMTRYHIIFILPQTHTSTNSQHVSKAINVIKFCEFWALLLLQSSLKETNHHTKLHNWLLKLGNIIFRSLRPILGYFSINNCADCN